MRFGNLLGLKKALVLYPAILSCLLLIFISCKDENPGTKEGTGGLHVQLIWESPSRANSSQITRQANTLPSTVTIVKFIVSASDINSVIKSFEASAGSGIIDNIPVGSNRTLTAQGLSSDSVVIYEGTETDISISSGMNTDVGTLTMAATSNVSIGFVISSISSNTSENGDRTSFTIKLNSEPRADVTIAISSSNTTEAVVSPSSLIFTSSNWNINQIVNVTGVDDNIQDGNQSYTVILGAASSDDADYDQQDPADVGITNIDNDTAGFMVSSISGNSTEAGGTATFTIKLSSEPTADVTIAISSSDTTEGSVSPASLTFTSVNWNTNQMVTVIGVDDTVQDGNQSYIITLGTANSDDSDYNGQTPTDVSVTNTDNDTAGFTISGISGNSTEAGGTATFTIKLSSEPTADVTIAINSLDTTEGVASPSGITFTPVNWNINQMVTVTGVDDAIQDGNQSYTIDLGAASSSDSNYNNLNPNDISVINTDNEVAPDPSCLLGTSQIGSCSLD